MNALISRLSELRKDFTPAAAKERLLLLRQAARQAIRPAESLRAYHDALLYQCAYPDSARLLQIAERELLRIATAVNAAFENATAKNADALEHLSDTGIAGSVVEHGFSIDLLRWLHARFGPNVELAWDDGSLGAAFDEFLQAATRNPELDGLFDTRISTQEWVRAARGKSQPSDLAWLLRLLDRVRCPPALLESLITSAGVRVRWRLPTGTQPAAIRNRRTRKQTDTSKAGYAMFATSRTFTRFPPRPLFMQTRPLLRDVELSRVLNEKLPAATAMSLDQSKELIDAARATLAVRGRETDPITWANPHDVTLFQLDRGLDVALFGMLPVHRPPVESYVGFVAARNHVPIAYGGGWIFFHRCEIGVNLFEEFRGGESAFIFSQVMRVYRQRFDARQFLVDPYQFGADNQEGLDSGAFWFYYRLGFRPIDSRLQRLAATENAQIRADRTYRSPRRVMRQLTGSKLFLDVALTRSNGFVDVSATSPDTALRAFSPVAPDTATCALSSAAPGTAMRAFLPLAPELSRLGLALTTWIGRRCDGDRDAAHAGAAKRLKKLLPIGKLRSWSASEVAAFERLGPLVAMIDDLADWPARDRAAVVEVLRTRGGTKELAYIQALQNAERLLTAWRAASAAPE